MVVELALLRFAARRLASPHLQPGLGGCGPRSRGAEPAAADVERIPPKPEAVSGHRQQGAERKHGQAPSQRGEGAQENRRPTHGNAFRSSSK